MTPNVSFEISVDEAGQRVDALIAARLPDVTRSLAAKLIDNGHVMLNGALVKRGRRVAASDRVDVHLIFPPALSAAPEDIPLHIVYHDQDLAVIDKPAGLVVHPAAGHAGGTLANALVSRFPATQRVGAPERPGIVHRLDKDTSGLIVVALTPAAHTSLQKQIAARTAERLYLALVSGHPEPQEATIRAAIGRDPVNRKRMAVNGVAAREAETTYKILESLGEFSLVEAKLRTGRTHQIRVHMSATGHPLVGDRLYQGSVVQGLDRQFLHAFRLSFDSPTSGVRFQFDSELPSDLARVLDDLRSGEYGSSGRKQPIYAGHDTA